MKHIMKGAFVPQGRHKRAFHYVLHPEQIPFILDMDQIVILTHAQIVFFFHHLVDRLRQPCFQL